MLTEIISFWIQLFPEKILFSDVLKQNLMIVHQYYFRQYISGKFSDTYRLIIMNNDEINIEQIKLGQVNDII